MGCASSSLSQVEISLDSAPLSLGWSARIGHPHPPPRLASLSSVRPARPSSSSVVSVSAFCQPASQLDAAEMCAGADPAPPSQQSHISMAPLPRARASKSPHRRGQFQSALSGSGDSRERPQIAIRNPTPKPPVDWPLEQRSSVHSSLFSL